MPFDVLIVGGGPAGLATSIRIKQLCQQNNTDLSVCLIDKGRYANDGGIVKMRQHVYLVPHHSSHFIQRNWFSHSIR